MSPPSSRWDRYGGLIVVSFGAAVFVLMYVGLWWHVPSARPQSASTPQAGACRVLEVREAS
jgi:hypothetical protein